MKIAIVRREPKVAFSMDVYADNLVAELRTIRPNWEIVEIAPQPWSKDLENLWQSGNPLRKYYERFYNHPRAVKELDADLFHIIDHTNAHVAYWLEKLGKPVVVTCHDLVQYIYPEILKNQSRFPAFSMAVWKYSVRGIQVADRTIAVSSNTAKDISNWLDVNLERIAVVPNGVESEFRPLPKDIVREWRSQYSSSDDEICLLNIGSTHQRKNILTILKVVKSIAERGISVRLWKISDDFSPEQQQYIKEHGLSEHITFIGKCDRESLIRFYNAADVLLAPSFYEGFGLTILEAMACGTPVITANVSALPEVAGDAAILLSPTDIEGIANAVLQLHRDLAWTQTLIQKGLERVKSFSWNSSVRQIVDVYEQLTVDLSEPTIVNS